MDSNAGYALLIGVDDYSSHGASSSLRGSREDVVTLYWFARVVLRLPPENIRVLASPPLREDEFNIAAPPSDMRGEATRNAIQAGVEWLAGKMAQDTAAAGLLTFSGHGSFSKGKGSLLCPSDIGADLSNAVAVRDLAQNASLQKVRDRLTVVLDCCHVAEDLPDTAANKPTALPHDASADEVAKDWASFDISDRVLLAARLGQTAYQARLGRVYHGALTFALVEVAEQWKAGDGPGSGMDISNKQLHKRIRRLLSSLGLKQDVQLRVPESPMNQRKKTRKLPFFGTHARPTRRKPDGPLQPMQLPPDWNFTINIESTIVMQVVTQVPVKVTVGTNREVEVPGDELWYVLADMSSITNAIPNITTLTINGSNPEVDQRGMSVSLASDSFYWGDLGKQMFTGYPTSSCSQKYTFTTDKPSIVGNLYYFRGSNTSPTSGPSYTPWVVFDITPGTGTTGYSLNAVWWVLDYTSAPSTPPMDFNPTTRPDPPNQPGYTYQGTTSADTWGSNTYFGKSAPTAFKR